MAMSAHNLKYIELKLGHILYSVTFNYLEKVSAHIYPSKINVDVNSENYDYILAIQILRTSYEVEKRLEQLPSYLEKHGLVFASAALKYELGYYDDSILSALNGDEDAFEDMIVTFKNYNPDKIVTAQQEFSDFLIEIIGMVSAIMFPLDTALEKIEQMIKNEGALDRSQTFANSVFFGLDTLGKETFCYDFLVHDLDKLGMKRNQKSSRTNKKVPDAVEPIIPGGVRQEKLPDSVDFKNVSNENIVTSTVINKNLWDVCGWKGILFLDNMLS